MSNLDTLADLVAAAKRAGADSADAPHVQNASLSVSRRLGKIEPDAFQRGELQGHEYAINEVVHYELWFNEKEKLFWDFFSTEWRLDGVSQNDDERRILRVQR